MGRTKAFCTGTISRLHVISLDEFLCQLCYLTTIWTFFMICDSNAYSQDKAKCHVQNCGTAGLLSDPCWVKLQFCGSFGSVLSNFRNTCTYMCTKLHNSYIESCQCVAKQNDSSRKRDFNLTLVFSPFSFLKYKNMYPNMHVTCTELLLHIWTLYSFT